ncbi:hypothetical protein HYPSUDRAFT_67750 [Hypholoma sublateritium FD-334 SS-4]|uniref:F-box domain-containing protein n=1 Tax=Hypholoma sublateritium (strain FD-334 SS-4) TaxID=945553 RepID=A0A0D2L3P2_HYPSF|nr:hypothetical protein HYPSUDRAFT_67750 [Hypholoma sublateritium FD-334 SS-4]
MVFSCVPQSYIRVANLHESDTPLLQSLAIYYTNGSFPTVPPGIWAQSKILSGPSFERFSLCGYIESFSNYPVNWANITHLTLHSADMWQGNEVSFPIIDILRQTTRLISCDIFLSDYLPSGPSNIAEISLPFLKVLALSGSNSSSADRILSSTNAPLLEIFDNNLGTEHGLKDFLQRSPNIRELVLRSATSYDILAEYLRCCPLLTTFHFRGSNGNLGGADSDDSFPSSENAFLELFYADEEDQCLCPRLQYILIEGWLRISFEPLRKFILRKRGSIPGWKGVVMAVRCDTAAEALIEGLKLAVEGVRLDIICHTGNVVHKLDAGMGLDDEYGEARRPDWWPTAVSRPVFY